MCKQYTKSTLLNNFESSFSSKCKSVLLVEMLERHQTKLEHTLLVLLLLLLFLLWNPSFTSPQRIQIENSFMLVLQIPIPSSHSPPRPFFLFF